MDEITDQFRTEDAEEFKQLQAELEIAGLSMFLFSTLIRIDLLFQLKTVVFFNSNYVKQKNETKTWRPKKRH